MLSKPEFININLRKTEAPNWDQLDATVFIYTLYVNRFKT